MIPRLLHPITVVVEKFSSASTVYDEDAYEPVKQASRSESVTLPAQVLWGTKDGVEPSTLGLQDTDDGYVLFRKLDMDAIGYKPQRRDRITSIGTLTGLKLYITGVRPRGHYPDQGGYSLWQCNFKDRAPVSND